MVAAMGLTNTQVRNRVKWVRALLSGDYAQGHGLLKYKKFNDEFEYCCLGVACEVLAPAAAEIRLRGDGVSGGYISSGRAEIRLGMGQADQSTCSQWNDASHYSFERIADFIAYATDHDIPIRSVGARIVPEGYATEWLERV